MEGCVSLNPGNVSGNEAGHNRVEAGLIGANGQAGRSTIDAVVRSGVRRSLPPGRVLVCRDVLLEDCPLSRTG
jgi:hypothetical protein